MGKSRAVTWQERGRAFQAHVYIGARASDRLRRDVASVLEFDPAQVTGRSVRRHATSGSRGSAAPAPLWVLS